MRRLAPVAAALTLAACGVEGATPGDQLLIPDDVELGWDTSFNRRGDGRAVLVPIDVMVYSPSGEPVEGASVVLTAHAGAGLVRPEAVLAVGADESRDVWWDAWRDRYFAFAAGEEPAHVLDLETDGTGLARAWVFVDHFAPDARGFVPAQVTVAFGETEDSLLLIPR